MSKQESTNTFGEGLVMDLNPLTTPNNVLTNALNATLITYNGNEFVLQNDLGNGRVETAKLPSGYVPLGTAEYGGIVYVASYNPITRKGQLGSFPSPERNLTQDEVSDKKLSISKQDFCEGSEIKYYYKRIDVMPENMYLNPGDKFGLFITGTGYDLLSYYSDTYSKAVTFHPAILDDLGNINYIDEECKIDGKYAQGLIFGQDVGDLSTVDGYNAAFEKLLVYKGKKSGKLVLIVELETLEDFTISRSISSNKIVKNTIGSTDVAFSDDDGGEDSSFKVTFYNSGWPKEDNNFIRFTGIKFESNLQNFDLLASEDTISYALNGFKREDILKYKIIPYTQLGACEALSRTGIINFSLLGTGNIIFTEWRYYVENNSLRINYGLDTNLLEGESIKEMSFEFYDVYYNKIYDNKYICSSTINQIYNGNYTEIFDLPYDLNYEGEYSEQMSNKDYIANSVLGIDVEKNGKVSKGSYILKNRELLKNNLYCVKITITTTGLNNEDQSKSFFRFLWTTGCFNEEYIKGKELNFSVLQVPESYLPKFKLDCKYDTSDSSTFDINYLNSPTQNGAKFPFIYSSTLPSDKSVIKSNLYQDWELNNANITIETKLESNKPIFGDYNPGWININSSSEITVSYDNSAQLLEVLNGKSDQDIYDYVDLTTDTNKVHEYSESPALSGLNQGDIKTNPDTLFKNEYKNLVVAAFRDGKISKSEYDKELKFLEEINDTQFYYIQDKGSSLEITSEEGKDTVIKLSNIKGRLIRRLSGNSSTPEYTSVTINELRPCLYRNMNASELKNLVAGSSYDASNGLGSTGDAVLFGGDAKGHDNIFAFWGAADGYVDNAIQLQNIQDPGNGQGLSYNTIRKELASTAGNCVIYPAQSSNYSDIEGEDHGALGVGFYTDNTPNRPYNSAFEDYFYEEGTRTYTFKSVSVPPIVTITLWRTSDSSETDTKFGAINLGATGGYSSYITQCLIPLLKAIHLLHKDINRELYIEKLIRMLYHGIFPTKVNIGIEVDFDSESQTSSSSINITKSPIKLYDGEDFSKDTISERLSGIGWNIEEDKWFKSVEDLSGGKDVLQCSYLNIPYGKIISVDENNVEQRAELGSGFVNIDMSGLTSIEEGKYMLGCSLDLGGQMDVSTIVDLFNSYLETSYKPTFIYVPNGDSFDLIEGVDSLGNPLTGTQVYYLGSNGEYVAGNTDEANKVDIFGQNKHCKMKGLFSPMTLNGYTVPILNISAAGPRIEKLSTNISNGGNRKHVSDINYYRDVYFNNNTPLKV